MRKNDDLDVQEDLRDLLTVFSEAGSVDRHIWEYLRTNRGQKTSFESKDKEPGRRSSDNS